VVAVATAVTAAVPAAAIQLIKFRLLLTMFTPRSSLRAVVGASLGFGQPPVFRVQ
jgi:hypothetical protein